MAHFACYHVFVFKQCLLNLQIQTKNWLIPDPLTEIFWNTLLYVTHVRNSRGCPPRISDLFQSLKFFSILRLSASIFSARFARESIFLHFTILMPCFAILILFFYKIYDAQNSLFLYFFQKSMAEIFCRSLEKKQLCCKL